MIEDDRGADRPLIKHQRARHADWIKTMITDRLQHLHKGTITLCRLHQPLPDGCNGCGQIPIPEG